jgi:hypothetical protein
METYGCWWFVRHRSTILITRSYVNSILPEYVRACNLPDIAKLNKPITHCKHKVGVPNRNSFEGIEPANRTSFVEQSQRIVTKFYK